MVNDIDYTAVDGMGLRCKVGFGVAVPMRRDLVTIRVRKLYSVVLPGAIRIAES